MNKLFIVLSLLISANTFSGDGMKLLDDCGQARILWNGGAADKAKGSYCIGLVNGVMASLVMVGNSSDLDTAKRFGMCKPDKSGTFIDTGEAIRTVHNYLENNVDIINMPDAVVAWYALKLKYPCNAKTYGNLAK